MNLAKKKKKKKEKKKQREVKEENSRNTCGPRASGHQEALTTAAVDSKWHHAQQGHK